MKKVLISRYGAYGDVLHCSHLPSLFKSKGYDYVAFETNHKGYQVLLENPDIDNLIYFDPLDNGQNRFSPNRLAAHWNAISEGYDFFLNLVNSLERKYIAMEDMPDYYMDDIHRRKRGDVNYYDAMTLEAGFDEEVGTQHGKLFFNDKENQIIEDWLTKKELKDKFVVLINLAGSSLQKKFTQAKELIYMILESYSDAVLITTGDESSKKYSLAGKRIINLEGKWPFRQVMHLAKHVNLTIGHESGMMIASNIHGTPTIQLMTSSSLRNHPNYCENDLSLQSPARCSPCNRGPYRFVGCPSKGGLPVCVYFDLSKIMRNVEKAYNARTHELQ